MKNKLFSSCLKDSLPVAIAYVPVSIAFGVLATSGGFSLFESLLSSIFVFSGSMQLILLAMVEAKLGILGIFISAVLINMRHFFYTLTLLPDIKNLPFFYKHYSIFALTDESFAILSSKNMENEADKKFIYVLICGLNHFYWILGTILGCLLAKFSKIDYSSLSFALTALFTVLAFELFRKTRSNLVLSTAILFGLIGIVIIPKDYMLVSCIFASFLFLLFNRSKLERKFLP